MGKLLQLLARPHMDPPDEGASLGFGLPFAHTCLFCLLTPKPEAPALAGENPPHHARKNVACGGFNCHVNFLRARGPTGPMLRQEQPGVAVPGMEKMD